MKILVTGGTGFVGKNVIEFLIDRNHQPVCIVRDRKKLLNLFDNKYHAKILCEEIKEPENLTSKDFREIIECNNINGVSIRSQADNTVVPGDNLVATNHFRTLYSPVHCSRYDGIADSLVASIAISSERSWSILTDAAGIPNNLHAIQYNVFSHALRWATTVSMPAYLQNPTDFNLDILFNYQTGIENQNESQQYPKFILAQNYPNPFNISTTIEFSLRYSQFVSITIYNCRGEEVVTLASETLPHGIHKFNWNASDLTNGVYFCRLTTDTFEWTKKLLLLK